MLLGLAFHAIGQGIPPEKTWYLLDPEKDNVQGMSVERAYAELLRNKSPQAVIVAIIDGGTDVDHEDLRRIIWTNPGELAGNGIDDDHNGYVDDIHGWNFIGGPGGEVNQETNELTRQFVRLHKVYGGKPDDKQSSARRKEYEEYIRVKEKFTRLREKSVEEYEYYRRMNANFVFSLDTICATLGVASVTPAEIDSLKPTNPVLSFAKGFVRLVLESTDSVPDLAKLRKDLQSATDHYRDVAEFAYNPDFDPRPMVGDNLDNPRERYYGNNNVKGPDPRHGTHVAGIIGADRSNEVGIRGVSGEVRIMVIRAVPNGDERDKDIANAIRYAAEHGAKIINMSFGKSLSPDKVVVDEAVAFAASKGVLFVHGTGNENQDNDKKPNFPERKYLDGKSAPNWLEVGASGRESGKDLVADFSNYGHESVDVFAPGVDILSTVPDNKYEEEDGTSMAAPMVSGLAALIWSYFPEFSALDVAEIIKTSARRYKGLKVNRPGGGTILFEDLSTTGGIVNAYAALRLASVWKEREAKKYRAK
jgi:cell wall-associated protease